MKKPQATDTEKQELVESGIHPDILKIRNGTYVSTLSPRDMAWYGGGGRTKYPLSHTAKLISKEECVI